MNKTPRFRENKKRTDIVAYLTIIGWLIAWFAGNRKESQFHLNQALVIHVADLLLNALFLLNTLYATGLLARISRGTFSLLDFCVWCLWLLALIRAVRESEKPIPIFGELHFLHKNP